MTDWVIAGLTAGILTATGIYAFYSIRLWKATRNAQLLNIIMMIYREHQNIDPKNKYLYQRIDMLMQFLLKSEIFGDDFTKSCLILFGVDKEKADAFVKLRKSSQEHREDIDIASAIEDWLKRKKQ